MASVVIIGVRPAAAPGLAPRGGIADAINPGAATVADDAGLFHGLPSCAAVAICPALGLGKLGDFHEFDFLNGHDDKLRHAVTDFIGFGAGFMFEPEQGADLTGISRVDNTNAVGHHHAGAEDATAGEDEPRVPGGNINGQPEAVAYAVALLVFGDGHEVVPNVGSVGFARDDGVGMGLGEFDFHSVLQRKRPRLAALVICPSQPGRLRFSLLSIA